ncbi:MAG: hypothetical protein LQ346_003578 [Caloplaca aetnensis]|nr:MAG: hypothetical protein LQ346_003578 [Caloplaca aetnensis]
MRPPARPKPAITLPVHIAVLPEAAIADLPMPEPKHILVDRDVESHDWSTFVNHILPNESAAPPSAGVKARASDEKGRVEHTIDLDPPSSEFERQVAVKAVVEEWNRGFFLPRGIQIVAQVEATPRPGALVANQSTRTFSRNLCPSAGRSPRQRPRLTPSEGQRKEAGLVNDNKELWLALYRAVEKQDSQTTKLLLEAGADPNAGPGHQAPAIVVAVKKDNTELLKMLLEHGADVDAYAAGGGTALYNAVSKGKTDLVEILLKYNADPNSRPCGADPPLHRAVSKDFDEIVRLLLEHGVNVDDAPSGGSTALYVAAVKKGNVELVQRLLDAGARSDATSCGANTALFEAAKKGHREICRLLLTNGAKVDAKTCGGSTALYTVVSKRNDQDLVRLLLEHGADINAKIWGGESPLERAVNKGLKDMVQLMLQYAPKPTKS